jgi:hypothetical protein
VILGLAIGLLIGVPAGVLAICIFASGCPECENRARQERRLRERVGA